MKPPQFFITLILAAICLVLSVFTFWMSQSLNATKHSFSDDQIKIQTDIQNKQAEINRGTQFNQVYQNMIKDIASQAYDPTGKVKDERLKDLLTKAGITVNVQQPAPTPHP